MNAVSKHSMLNAEWHDL